MPLSRQLWCSEVLLLGFVPPENVIEPGIHKYGALTILPLD